MDLNRSYVQSKRQKYSSYNSKKKFVLAPLFFNTSLELGEGKISQFPARNFERPSGLENYWSNPL